MATTMKSKSKHVHKHRTDPDFRYTPSTSTDIGKTFARIKREMAQKARAAAGSPPVARTPKVTAPAAVTPIRGRVKG